MGIVIENLVSLREFLLPVLFVASAFFIGLLIERLVLNQLREKLNDNPDSWQALLFKSLGLMPLVWSVLLGVYGAIHIFPMDSSFKSLLGNTLLVIILFSVTVITARIVGSMLTSYTKKTEGLFPPGTSIFVTLAQCAVYMIGVLIILQSIGISITPVLTALGVGGLAVALALQDTLSNLFSGINIILARRVKISDYIRLDSGEEGYVRDITWRYTVLEAMISHMIVVPNSKIASAIITNFSLPIEENYISLQIRVSYDSDLEKVEQISKEIVRELMQEIEGGVPGFEPVVRFHTFGDSSIQFNLGFRVQHFSYQFAVRHELVKRIHARFAQEGIIIPFPIQTIQLDANLPMDRGCNNS